MLYGHTFPWLEDLVSFDHLVMLCISKTFGIFIMFLEVNPSLSRLDTLNLIKHCVKIISTVIYPFLGDGNFLWILIFPRRRSNCDKYPIRKSLVQLMVLIKIIDFDVEKYISRKNHFYVCHVLKQNLTIFPPMGISTG